MKICSQLENILIIRITTRKNFDYPRILFFSGKQVLIFFFILFSSHRTPGFFKTSLMFYRRIIDFEKNKYLFFPNIYRRKTIKSFAKMYDDLCKLIKICLLRTLLYNYRTYNGLLKKEYPCRTLTKVNILSRAATRAVII